MKTRALGLLASVVYLATGCRESERRSPAELARKVYAVQCAACHGSEGKGDGHDARFLAVRPRDYTDRTWQASVTDEQIRTVILGGGPALGKSAQMPATPMLKNEPAVTKELVLMIRDFGTTR